MNAAAKCKFAKLKYEQLLSDKYFVKTCFSRKIDSIPAKQRLLDLLLAIKFDK